MSHYELEQLALQRQQELLREGATAPGEDPMAGPALRERVAATLVVLATRLAPTAVPRRGGRLALCPACASAGRGHATR